MADVGGCAARGAAVWRFASQLVELLAWWVAPGAMLHRHAGLQALAHCPHELRHCVAAALSQPGTAPLALTVLKVRAAAAIAKLPDQAANALDTHSSPPAPWETRWNKKKRKRKKKRTAVSS